MEIRPLVPSDFLQSWDLFEQYIDPALKPDIDRANRTFMQVLSDSASLGIGQFSGDTLMGAILVSGNQNAFAKKGFASIDAWAGSVELLDEALKWWEGRPVLRFVSLQFPMHVNAGMYRILRMRGFHRQGDMNMLWR